MIRKIQYKVYNKTDQNYKKVSKTCVIPDFKPLLTSHFTSTFFYNFFSNFLPTAILSLEVEFLCKKNSINLAYSKIIYFLSICKTHGNLNVKVRIISIRFEKSFNF